MKLSLLHETGHWQVLRNYPGSIVRGGTNTHTIFVDPKERRRSFTGKNARGVWGREKGKSGR